MPHGEDERESEQEHDQREPDQPELGGHLQIEAVRIPNRRRIGAMLEPIPLVASSTGADERILDCPVARNAPQIRPSASVQAEQAVVQIHDSRSAVPPRTTSRSSTVLRARKLPRRPLRRPPPPARRSPPGARNVRSVPVARAQRGSRPRPPRRARALRRPPPAHARPGRRQPAYGRRPPSAGPIEKRSAPQALARGRLPRRSAPAAVGEDRARARQGDPRPAPSQAPRLNVK